MGQIALVAQLVSKNKNYGWNDRFRANRSVPCAGIVQPPAVLVPGSSLGSRRGVALPSAQAVSHRSALQVRTQEDRSDRRACRGASPAILPTPRRLRVAIPRREDHNAMVDQLVARRRRAEG